MKLINLLRAKSGDQENFLLRDHILETLRRVKHLREFVEINAESIICEQLKDSEFLKALARALILHDLGKIDYTFQRMVYAPESEDWKELKEFLKPLRNINIRHEILSSIWASILLNNSEWNAKIRTAILLHHYNEYFVNEKDIMEIVHSYFEGVVSYLKFLTERWDKIWEFLDNLLNAVNEEFDEDFIKSAASEIRNNLNSRVKELLEKIENREDDISEFAEFYRINNEKPEYGFLLFLGCLRRFDYSASGSVDLERRINMEGVYRELKEKIRNRVKSKLLWQEDFLKEIDPLKSIVLVAPTGAGKTELALLWAEKNKRKLIYTLPLRVALNDLFLRFRETDDAYFKKEFVDILHSTAFIEYLEEERASRSLDIEKQLTASKLLSSPILLTTPDQVFLTSLNYYGSDKVLAVYPLSSIVIDEIQTYDVEMASVIVKTLEIVRDVGGTVLVMTATLPPYFEPFLRDLGFDFKEPEDIKEKVKNYNIRRHKIKVVNRPLIKYENNGVVVKESEEFKAWLENFKDKNTFIVVNNVSKAIEIYDWLRKRNYPNIFLLHSRLIEKEKDRRIKLIKELVKQNKDKEEIDKLVQEEEIYPNKPVIVVATQIIEASVDLDFDAMITEVSAIDSQIQRWGRVHRNRDEDYLGDNPNIIVFTQLDKGTLAIYRDKKVLEKTIDVLKDYEGMVLGYEEERKMVKEVFDKEVEGFGEKVKLKDLYIYEIRKNLEFLKYFTVEKKSQAQRLFRRIAGIQVVIPAIMKHIGNDLERKFAEIIEKPDWNQKPWEEITSQFEDLLRDTEDHTEIKWELKKVLYEYSVNVPIFFWEKGRLPTFKTHEFKGFQVLNVSESQAREVYVYGIDQIFKREEDSIENSFL